jgi:hypothetical protein
VEHAEKTYQKSRLAWEYFKANLKKSLGALAAPPGRSVRDLKRISNRGTRATAEYSPQELVWMLSWTSLGESKRTLRGCLRSGGTDSLMRGSKLVAQRVSEVAELLAISQLKNRAGDRWAPALVGFLKSLAGGANL